MKIGGLALAASISGGVNFLTLFIILRKRIGSLGEMRIYG
jgi:peptidoglycan biosynthesis protein MviN/MurJ (putative lipid II flippase)